MELTSGTGTSVKDLLSCSSVSYHFLLLEFCSPKSGSFLVLQHGFQVFTACQVTKNSGPYTLQFIFLSIVTVKITFRPLVHNSYSSSLILGFRFVLPVLPIALMFSGYSLARMSISDSRSGKRKGSSNVSSKWPPKMRLAIFVLLATNIPMALYMSLIHQVHRFALQWTYW